MTAKALPLDHGDLAAEMTRLHGVGFSLLPLGRGADGKAPLLGFAGIARLPLRRVLAPMHRTGSTCYGLRLDGLVVIDCDTDDPALVMAMEARFGASPVHVHTPRGRHLYYRAPDLERPAYPNLKAEGLAVDIKRGATSYVMGPGSVRPDGGAYVPAKGVLGHDELPVVRLASAPVVLRAKAGERIAQGGRHDLLVRAALAIVEAVESPADLLRGLCAIRDNICESPSTMSEDELRDIADWAWSRRLEGRIYRGRHSAFTVERQALDALRTLPNASEATALFVTLQDQHGHRPGVTFPLDHTSMKAASRTDLTRRRFVAARDALIACGLLQVATLHVAGRAPRTYRLCRPLSAAANVAPLHRGGGGGGRV